VPVNTNPGKVYNRVSPRESPVPLVDWFLRNREWLAAAVILASGLGIGAWELFRWVQSRK